MVELLLTWKLVTNHLLGAKIQVITILTYENGLSSVLPEIPFLHGDKLSLEQHLVQF